MANRRRKRNVWPDKTARSLYSRKLPANASIAEIEMLMKRREQYQRLKQEERLSAFRRMSDLRNPAEEPRTRKLKEGFPNAYRTVWYTGHDRRK